MSDNMNTTSNFTATSDKKIEQLRVELENQIKTSKENMLKEIKYISAQTMSTYEALEEKINDNYLAVLKELRYTYQQNLSVYELTTDYVKEHVAEKIEKLNDFSIDLDQLSEKVAKKINVDQSPINLDELAEKVAQKIIDKKKENSQEKATEENTEKLESTIDYDLLAEKISAVLPDTDYDRIIQPVVEQVIAGMPEVDYTTLAKNVSENITLPENQQTDLQELGEIIAEKVVVPETIIDTEEIAEKIKQKIMPDAEKTMAAGALGVIATQSLQEDNQQEEVKEPIVEETCEETIAEPQEETKDVSEEEETAPKVIELEETVETEKTENVEQTQELAEDTRLESFIEDKLMEKWDTLVDEFLKKSNDQFPEKSEKIANLVVEKIKSLPSNYFLDPQAVAEKLADILNNNGATMEEIEEYLQKNQTLSEEKIEEDEKDNKEILSAMEEGNNKTNDLVKEVLTLLKHRQELEMATTVTSIVSNSNEEDNEKEKEEIVSQEELAENSAIDTETVGMQEQTVEQFSKEQENEEQESDVEDVSAEDISTVDNVENTAVVLEENSSDDEDENKEGFESITDLMEDKFVMRYKRSFEAKMRQSDEEIKIFYSEFKNCILSYDKVRSSVSWQGDRFNKGRDTIIKITMRGKTLCAYFALNPDEYPITVYHQKYAGDSKAYEKTPFLIKIKSAVGVKKAQRLVSILMEKLNVEQKEIEAVDYTAEYSYQSDEAMLESGLIKKTLVEKKELDF